MDLRRQRSNTRQERDHLSRDSTERGNRRHATDSRLVRYENDARLSANTINRENRKLSLSMDRVDMRDRRNPQARINVRRSMESKARFVAERPETRRHQEEQSSRLDVSRLRSLSDLEARVSRRIDDTVRSTNLQRTRMTREIQYTRSIEQNMESRVFREREHSRRSLHREVAYAPEEIRSVRHSSERIFVARDLQQNERHETELFRNLNTERTNVRRNFNELSQRTSDRIENYRIVRDMSRFDERRNVKSRFTSYPTEQRENRRNDERRFMQNENRLRDFQSRENIRQEHSVSDVTQRTRIIRELSEKIRKSADEGIIRSVSERGIPGGRISKMERTNNRDSIVRKTSERVKSIEKRQDFRTVRRNERDLSRSIRLDLRQNDLKSINRQVRSYRVDTDSRSKLEGQLNNILTLGTNDKRNAMDNDQRKEDGSYILNWQHFFYIIQGLYLCSVLLHVHINDTKSKIISRNFGWWKSMYGLKLD
ncbi:PREDICTED: flagellar attachment zone protein 1-like [Papilio xuthus]|uniref:Flagellar attachment zone protein 1-like n=1 Tax=Papilio xuthus TaxID=66420 RepID=A0AAJ7E7Z1_PAPXU|nr:PREDICTED: flagellar attachment zone protein 1-like [Papilio xuthus]